MKEKYIVKAVFSDIDGTLLNSQHVVTDLTRTTIHRITDNGILFTLASSRHCFLKDGKLISLKKEIPDLDRAIISCM